MSVIRTLNHYEREDVERALEHNHAEELRSVVVAVALSDPDYAFAHELCIRLAQHEDPTVRGNALLGVGHLARRFGQASDEARSLVNAGLQDRDPHVKAQSESAFDDIQVFAPEWKR